MIDASGGNESLDVTAAARSYRGIWRGCLLGGLAGISTLSALLMALQTDIHAAAGAPKGVGVTASIASGTAPTTIVEIAAVMLGVYCLTCTGRYSPRRAAIAGIALFIGAGLMMHDNRHIFRRMLTPEVWSLGTIYAEVLVVAWLLGAIGAAIGLAVLWRGTHLHDGRTTLDCVTSFFRVGRARRRRHRLFRLSRIAWMIPAVVASLIVAVILQLSNGLLVRQWALGIPTGLMRNPEENRIFVETHLGVSVLAAIADIVQIVITVAAVALILRFFWRLVLADARRLLTDPSYKPIVFLRSFQDDAASVSSKRLFNRLVRRKRRIEEVAAAALAPLGAAIAIGKPGERLPELGALRAYYTGDDWQAAVLDWMCRAELIVLVAGLTHWTLWELGQVISQGYRGKLIILVPPDSTPERHAMRCRALAQAAAGSPWEVGLGSVETRGTIGLLLRGDGSVMAIKGNPNRQSDYEIALMLAALELVEPS